MTAAEPSKPRPLPPCGRRARVSASIWPDDFTVFDATGAQPFFDRIGGVDVQALVLEDFAHSHRATRTSS